MSENKLIYLASPYTSPSNKIMELRYEQVCEATALLMCKGFFIFSPIAHGHGPAQYGLPKDYEYWKQYCELMLPRCDEVFVLKLPGWTDSKGVNAETELARQLSIKVTYISLDDLRCDRN